MISPLVWMFTAGPVVAALLVASTFLIIHLDERPKKKRKR